MKKLLSVSIATFALAAVAAYTPTTIGVTKITTTEKSTIVPVAFKSLATGNSIAVKDLVKAANLPSGTMLYVYNGSTYSAYQNGNGTWSGVAVVEKIDGVNTASAGDPTLTLNAGSAVWIVLATKPETSQDIYIYGAYATGITSTAAAGVSTLVANPLQSTATISIEGVAAGDSILVPKGDATDPDRYVCLKVESGVPTWKKSRQTVSLPEFSTGQGFWYVRPATSGAATITWTAK